MRLVRVPLGRVHGKAEMVDRSILKIRGVRTRISSEILRRRGGEGVEGVGEWEGPVVAGCYPEGMDGRHRRG
jgi:hypothetical protein